MWWTSFPVTLLFGVSKFLFSALALSFVLALLASYVVAMTVIPLFCARFLKAVPGTDRAAEAAKSKPVTGSGGPRFNAGFNRGFNRVLDVYECAGAPRAEASRRSRWLALLGVFVASLVIYPFLGRAFFPHTDAGQFTVNIKAPTGTRIEVTNDYVAKIEDMIRKRRRSDGSEDDVFPISAWSTISPRCTPPTRAQYTATIQVALNDEHTRQQPRVHGSRARDA